MNAKTVLLSFVFASSLSLTAFVPNTRAADAIKHAREILQTTGVSGGLIVARNLLGFCVPLDLAPQPRGNGRRLAGVIRLRGALGDDRIGALLQRVGQQKLQFAGLVPATGQPCAVVPLDP